MRLVFHLLSGARAGEVVEVDLAGGPIRIGRGAGCQVACDPARDLQVSARHAEVRRDEAGRAVLVDLGSSNGTFVGDARIQQHPLVDGDVVTLGKGGPRLRVRLAGEPSGGGAPQGPPGHETVARMVAAAVREARPAGGTTRLRALVNQAVRRGTHRLRLAVAGLSLLLLLALGLLLWQRGREGDLLRAEQARLRRAMVALMERQGVADGPAQKARIAAELDRFNRRLAPSPGRAIVERNQRAVFLVAARDPAGRTRGFCTAFAVGRRLLATNGHCVVVSERLRAAGRVIFLVMNGRPARRLRVTRWARHPGYHPPRGAISPDVGLLWVREDLPARVRVAPPERLRQVQSGDIMFTYGFPGRLARVSAPVATLVQGVVGRVTRLDGAPGRPEDRFLIQHSAFTSGGTSGSPIFDERGAVIAVNTGSYVEPGTLQVKDPATGEASRVQVSRTLAGYNFGIRIDVLLAFAEGLGERLR